MTYFKYWISFFIKRINIATAIVFFILSFELTEILDVSIIDTYYVIPGTWVFIFIGIIYLIFGSIQWRFERSIQPLHSIIIWSHYLVTTTTLCLVLFPIDISFTTLINEMIYLSLAVQAVYILAICYSLFVIVRDAFVSK